MIKLKNLLTEQSWRGAYTTIPTKNLDLFKGLKHTTGTAKALIQFSEGGKKKVAEAFDQFVQQNSKRRIKRRGRITADFDKLPDVILPAEQREPKNEAYTIDCDAQFADNVGTSSTIDQDVMTALSEYIKQRRVSLQQQYPNSTIGIGLTSYGIVSTTSMVPSSNPGNPVLVKERYDSMKTAFTNAAAALKLPGATSMKEEDSVQKPDIGPTWEDVKDNFQKQVVDGKVVKVNINGVTMAKRVDAKGNDTTAAYEKRFAKSRKAFIRFQVDIKIENQGTGGKVIKGESNEIFAFSIDPMEWPSISIPLPKLRLPKLKRTKVRKTKKIKPRVCPDWGRGERRFKLGKTLKLKKR